MRASVPISTGITAPIDIVAHDLNLDLPEPLPVASALSAHTPPLHLGLPQAPTLEDVYLDRQRSVSPTAAKLPDSESNGTHPTPLAEGRPSVSSPPPGSIGGRRSSLAAYSDFPSSRQVHGRAESTDSRSSGAISSINAHPPRPAAPVPSSISSQTVEQQSSGTGRSMSQQSEHFMDSDEEQEEQEPPPPFEDAVRGDLVDWVAAEQRFGGRD